VGMGRGMAGGCFLRVFLPGFRAICGWWIAGYNPRLQLRVAQGLTPCVSR